MKKSAIFLTVALAMTVMSCKTMPQPGKGSIISFNSTTSGNEWIETKTTYADSPVLSGGKSIYRINWEVGDQLLIGSDDTEVATTATYTVATVSELSTTQSSATLSSSGSGLRWGDDGEHTFFAAYGASSLSTDGKAAFSLPVDQTQGSTSAWNGNTFNMVPNSAYMYMTASATVTKSESNPTPDISLQFKYLPTVIDLTIGTQDNLSIEKVTIESSSVNISSTAINADIATPDAGGYPTVTMTSPSKIVSVTPRDGSDPVALTSEKQLFCPLFFMTESTATEITDLTLKLHIIATGIDKTFSLKLFKTEGGVKKYFSFAPHKRHHITGVVAPTGASLVINGDATFITWDEVAETLNPTE